MVRVFIEWHLSALNQYRLRVRASRNGLKWHDAISVPSHASHAHMPPECWILSIASNTYGARISNLQSTRRRV